MFLRDIKAMPFVDVAYPARKQIFVQFFFSQEDPEDSGYSLDVYRQISNHDPIKIVTLDLNESYFFIDAIDPAFKVTDISYMYLLKKNESPVLRGTTVPVTLNQKHHFLSHRAFLVDYMREMNPKVGRGIEVKIVKKKRWGIFCRACGSLGSNSPTLHKCPVCGGTGYEGGFYEPFTQNISLEGLNMNDTFDGNMGHIAAASLTAQLWPYPVVESGDWIWVPSENMVIGIDNVQAYDGVFGATLLQLISGSKVNQFESPEFEFLYKKGVLA